MAKKTWVVRKRGFANPRTDSGCTTAWNYEVEHSKDWSMASLSIGNIHLDVYRRADLRAIQNMRKVLNEFEELAEKMLEDKDAASKEST